MRTIFGRLWQEMVNWLAVLGSAHVVDDGSDEKRDQPKKKQPPKLHLASTHG